MSRPRRVFVFGDSHAQPLVSALTAWSFVDETENDCVFADMVDCGLISLDLTIETHGRSEMLNPIFQRALEGGGLLNRFTGELAPENGGVGLLFGYADVNILGLVDVFYEAFDDDLLRRGPGAPSGAVNYAMLRELMRRRLVKVERTVGLLKRAGFSVFLMSGPPPSTDAAVAAHYPAMERAPAGARLSVWRAVQDVMAEIARRHGAIDLTDQSRFMDAEGFLLPQYVSDGIHANAEHGREYLTDIVAGLGLNLTATPRGGAAEIASSEADGEVATPQDMPDPAPSLGEDEPVQAESAAPRPGPTRRPGLARSVAQAFTRLR